MNLDSFTGPGSTPSRRRFWDKVTQAVIASQKIAGRFVTVDEHLGKGTVINVADNSSARRGGVCCCYCEDALGIPGYVSTITCSPAASESECAASCFTDPEAPCYTDFHPGEVCDYRCPFSPGPPFFIQGTPCPCNGACYLDDSFGTCYPYANQVECEFTIGGRYDPNSTCEGSYPGYPCGSDTPGVCCYFNYPAIGLCTSTNETCAECGNMFPGESHQWDGTSVECCCPCPDSSCSDNTGLPCPP